MVEDQSKRNDSHASSASGGVSLPTVSVVPLVYKAKDARTSAALVALPPLNATILAAAYAPPEIEAMPKL